MESLRLDHDNAVEQAMALVSRGQHSEASHAAGFASACTQIGTMIAEKHTEESTGAQDSTWVDPAARKSKRGANGQA